tara:strand:+ start:11426 stop:11683 length:258 start_codon:yes stop_codon:yes gene_type:complete
MELGPHNFLRTILIIVAIYYVSKFLLKFWVRTKIKQASSARENSVSEQEASHKQGDTGKVHIKSQTSQSKHQSSGGEYIDYEEVD